MENKTQPIKLVHKVSVPIFAGNLERIQRDIEN